MDAVVSEGFEQEDIMEEEITTMCLIPNVSKNINIPVIKLEVLEVENQC